MSESHNLPAVQQQHPIAQHTEPFGRMMAAGAGLNHGAVAIEQERAIAEAQGQLILAKKFPRSMAQAHADFMEACKSPEFASKAFYSVPNRGSGPSIRYMEEAARCYGNFQYGHRELSRSEGKSEIEVYAWDMEKNNRSIRQITVMHVMDTKNGPRKLIDQADIDNKIANVASKQVRGRIAALMPKALVEAGIAECKKTLAGANDKPIGQRVRDMTGAFAKFGVTVKHLEDYLGHSLDDTTLDELVDLTGVYNAIKDGAKASDYFGQAEKQDATAATAAAITNTAKQAAQAAAPTPATPARTTRGKAVQNESNPVKEALPESEQRAAQDVTSAKVAAPTPAPEPEQQAQQGPDDDEIF